MEGLGRAVGVGWWVGYRVERRLAAWVGGSEEVVSLG